MSPKRGRRSVDSGDTPGNPLRSYRMSMLAHGFLPEEEGAVNEMRPDKNESLTYSVGPHARATSFVPAVLSLVVIIALITIAVLVAT